MVLMVSMRVLFAGGSCDICTVDTVICDPLCRTPPPRTAGCGRSTDAAPPSHQKIYQVCGLSTMMLSRPKVVRTASSCLALSPLSHTYDKVQS